MGRHTQRTDLGREFGATDVIAERGEEHIERVRELTGGDGTPHGAGVRGAQAGAGDGPRRRPRRRRSQPRRRAAVRRGADATSTCSCATSRSPAASRPPAYIEELLPEVLDGRLQPGKVFDRAVDVAGGYRAMASREALKVVVNP
jgi:threonine dehydrogenase-like Zn-dependent dehydrogenase